MLQTVPISFSLVDLSLPDGNGIDFIENLRQTMRSHLFWSSRHGYAGNYFKKQYRQVQRVIF